MSAVEKNKKGLFSQVAAELLARSKESKEPLFNIHHLRDEIKKVTEKDKIFGKFRGLVESFRDILPEEKQRYDAAIKALSTTSGLSRQDVLKAADNLLEELKILENGLMSALSNRRDELKVMESKSRDIRSAISKLHEKIEQLEREKQEILDGMAAWEKEMKLVEKAVRGLFMDVGAEITEIRKKIDEFTAEKVSSRPTKPPDSIESHERSEESGGDKQESEIWEPSAPQETEWEKKCPMCEGQMSFYLNEKKWICYVCAYEESEDDDIRSESEPISASEPSPTSEPAPGASPPPAVPPASSPAKKLPSGRKKTCPVCRKKMDWHEMEKTWRCPSCEYQRMEF